MHNPTIHPGRRALMQIDHQGLVTRDEMATAAGVARATIDSSCPSTGRFLAGCEDSLDHAPMPRTTKAQSVRPNRFGGRCLICRPFSPSSLRRAA